MESRNVTAKHKCSILQSRQSPDRDKPVSPFSQMSQHKNPSLSHHSLGSLHCKGPFAVSRAQRSTQSEHTAASGGCILQYAAVGHQHSPQNEGSICENVCLPHGRPLRKGCMDLSGPARRGLADGQNTPRTTRQATRALRQGGRLAGHTLTERPKGPPTVAEERENKGTAGPAHARQAPGQACRKRESARAGRMTTGPMETGAVVRNVVEHAAKALADNGPAESRLEANSKAGRGRQAVGRHDGTTERAAEAVAANTPAPKSRGSCRRERQRDGVTGCGEGPRPSFSPAHVASHVSLCSSRVVASAALICSVMKVVPI